MSAESSPRKPFARVAFAGLASGVLLGLSFPPTDWSLLAWVALAPLGVVFSSRTMTARSWSGVYLGGLLCHLWVFDWMRTLYQGVGLQGNYLAGWLIVGQIGALLFCLMVAAGRRGVLVARLPVTIVLPLVWVCYEALQYPLTALFGQAGTRLLSLAYTQANQSIVAQLADLGGAGLISLVVALVNGFVYDATSWGLKTRRGDRNWAQALRLALVPLALLAVLVYGRERMSQNDFEPGPTVCLVGKGDLPPLLDESRIRKSCQPSLASGSTGPDLLVWPELAYHHALLTASEDLAAMAALDLAWPLANNDAKTYARTIRLYLEQAAGELRAGLMIGCERLEADAAGVRRYNCLAFADPARGFVGCYDKRYLAPFTEFTPAAGGWLRINSRKNYARGQEPTPFVLSADSGQEYCIGSALCYDVAFAEHFRQQLQNAEVAFFVLAGSEAADVTGGMSTMLLRMAQLRAIETRRPIIRNSYLGFSGLIDASGRLVQSRHRAELNTPWLLGAVPLDSRISFYSQWGEWLSPLCGCAVLLVLLAPLLRAKSLLLRPRPIAGQQTVPAASGRLPAAQRGAFSLLELMAVISILGTIALLVIPRVTASSAAVKEAADGVNRAQINAAVERWYLEKDVWPALDLSDIGADPNYFPEGIASNPVNNTPYALNALTHRVIVSGGGGGGK